MQILRKTDLWFQIWHEEFGKFSPNHSKVQTFHSNGLFLSKVYEVWPKKKERSYLSWQWTVMQNLRNPDIVVSKMAWRIGWTFIIRAPKSLKIVHWWALFVQSIYISVRKFQRNYASWQWRVLQSLNENWLVAWEIT